MSEKKGELYIRPIVKGTTIDHIRKGMGMKILVALGITDSPITAALQVASSKMGTKDLVFIENHFLDQNELDKVSLLSPGATINKITNGVVSEKIELSLPKKTKGIIECINPKCVTNNESLETNFLISKNPVKAKCFYCETSMTEKEFRERIK